MLNTVSQPELLKTKTNEGRRGRLFYIMGPSGVGKDTIINYLKETTEETIFFATRYITRPTTDEGEQHIELSKTQFQERLKEGFFAFAWQSHGLNYGIAKNIFPILDRGQDVILNGSRNYLAQALNRYPDTIPVLISASTETVRTRLEQRGRESAADIENRLQRLNTFSIQHPRLITIENESTPEEAATTLLTKVIHR